MSSFNFGEGGVSAFQGVVSLALTVLAFVWRHTFGKLEERVVNVEKRMSEGVEKKLASYEESCGICRQENEKHFASQDDLRIIREDYKHMMEHIDRRFDNLTAIIIGARRSTDGV